MRKAIQTKMFSPILSRTLPKRVRDTSGGPEGAKDCSHGWSEGPQGPSETRGGESGTQQAGPGGAEETPAALRPQANRASSAPPGQSSDNGISSTGSVPAGRDSTRACIPAPLRGEDLPADSVTHPAPVRPRIFSWTLAANSR